MRRLLVLGMAGIAVFAACCIFAVYVATEPDSSFRFGAGGEATPPQTGAAQQPGTRPSLPSLTGPAFQHLAGAQAAGTVPKWDPEGEAERKKAIQDTLRRGRYGKPPRSAEDLE